jgi:hypothetical protein
MLGYSVLHANLSGYLHKKELTAYLISLRATLSLLSISRVVLQFTSWSYPSGDQIICKWDLHYYKSCNRTTEKASINHDNNGVFLSQSTNLQSRVIWQNQSCSHNITKVKSWQKHALDILLPGQVMTRGPSSYNWLWHEAVACPLRGAQIWR